MPIARINEFQAADGAAEALHARLSSVVTVIESIDGCLSVSLLNSTEDPKRIVIYEVWESVDHHKAAAHAIPADEIQSTVAMLAQPPAGEYFILG